MDMMHRKNGLLVVALVAVLAVAALPLVGCDSTAAKKAAGTAGSVRSAPAFPVTVTDDAGRTVTIKSRPERIVSLAPADTEIVYALGAMDRVVGVTTYDDYPAQVKDIKKVGDFTTPNLEAIASLDPDLVLVTTGVQADVIAKLQKLGATVVAIDPQTLTAVYTSIGTVGAAIGETQKAGAVVSGMKGDLAAIKKAVGGDTVSCFVEIAQNPLYTAGAGTLIDDLITQAGGRNVVTQKGYVGYSLEKLMTDDPQVYLATKGSMSSPGDLVKRAGYGKLSAVKNDRIAVLTDDLVSRPGPRLVQGVRQIAEALHPEAFGK